MPFVATKSEPAAIGYAVEPMGADPAVLGAASAGDGKRIGELAAAARTNTMAAVEPRGNPDKEPLAGFLKATPLKKFAFMAKKLLRTAIEPT
ncbi:hypothetical protein [Branchiibius sp. NY16-3462-2]|uniref:hypothetical protein n=1 Tax=Branchiibius sp. NY16-3462-2 TaxID=1807500 RepID=UPI0025C0726E|nr:hypothetical protein [Branchiibius sp. NY16-3462-2]